MRTLRGEVLVEGLPGEGQALVLAQPISFWGGVDPATAHIANVRHPQHGASIGGRILFLPGTIGSSSASAVLMELVHRGIAPAALVLDHADAILLLGLIAAKEMGWETPVAVRLARERFAGLDGRSMSVATDGTIRF
jgi:predicted aconitase with swiveling domain